MIHFKSIAYNTKLGFTSYIDFIYDQEKDVYYTSSNIYNAWITKYYYCLQQEIWIAESGSISINAFLSSSVVREYIEYPPDVIDLILSHNKIYKRSLKINNLV